MANETTVVRSLTEVLRNSTMVRLGATALLMLLLSIPINWISALITERQTRRSEAVAEVSGKWGGMQTIVGPALIVPYTHQWTDRGADGRIVTKSELRHLAILPTQLHVHARADSEERYRGIFSVPVYRVALTLSGEFETPDLSGLRIDPTTMEWNRSVVAVSIADSRAIQNGASLTWNGAERRLQPGPAVFEVPSGIHAGIEQPFVDGRASFVLQMALNGSVGLYFSPAGQETSVTVESNWPSPSFQGAWLPTDRVSKRTGFQATWRIPFLGRNQEPMWSTPDGGAMVNKLSKAAFGVDFVTPVDAHRMADRSVKYARLFVLLTFGAIWLIEVLECVRVHPIQYLLIGCALCTFYLLELSLAEQFGFALAYAVASVAVGVLISLYAVVVLRGWRRAVLVATTVGTLYGYLYVVLMNEDYALLLGSIAVFLGIAVTMLLTRHVDWYAPARATN